MRALWAMAVVVAFGVASFDAAQAHDWRSRHVAYYPTSAVRAPQVIVYDVEPRSDIRAYWARPWQGRHYYPFTRKKPKVGRLENLNARYPAPKPAPSYYREWSTLSLYPPGVAVPPPETAPVVAPYAPLMPPR